MALSNNHQVHYGGAEGAEGLRDTLSFFRGPHGVAHAGIGESAAEAAAPATLRRAGLTFPGLARRSSECPGLREGGSGAQMSRSWRVIRRSPAAVGAEGPP